MSMAVPRPILAVTAAGASRAREDAVVAEHPLEVSVATPDELVGRVLTVTLRTPGHDRELAIGLLLAERVIRRIEDVAAIEDGAATEAGDRITIRLAPGAAPDEAAFARNQLATSACGACGKSELAALRIADAAPLPPAEPRLRPEVIAAWPERLRETQDVFGATGGLHGAAIGGGDGSLRFAREDVGRHNAVDKSIGARLLAGDASGEALVVSGRAGFELAQKAIVARIPALVAVGAPSSLAIELAERAGLTLIGFARDGRFNVYSGAARVCL
jgi:FdhD protein